MANLFFPIETLQKVHFIMDFHLEMLWDSYRAPSFYKKVRVKGHQGHVEHVTPLFFSLSM